MIELRQSTAGQEIPLGYFLDSTDGNTEELSLTIANTDIKLWKFGATTLANKNSGGATHISNGIYYCVLDATDTDTLGALIIFVHVSGALAVRVECAVLPANVWDSKYSTDKLQVDTVEVSGTAQTGNDNGEDINTILSRIVGTLSAGTHNPQSGDAYAIVNDGTYGNSAIETLVDELESRLTTTRAAYLDNLSAGAVAQASICTEARLSELDAANIPTDVDSLNTKIGTNTDAAGTTTVFARLRQIVDAYLADGTIGLAQIESLVDDLEARLTAARAGYLDNLAGHSPQSGDSFARIGENGSGMTALPWNAAWDTEVQSEVQDAIEVNHLDHLLAVDYDPALKPGTATALLNELVENDGGISRFTQNALEQAPGGGGGDATAANQIIIINHLTDMKDNNGGADFDSSTDSLEAVRNRGDAAWVTGGGIGGASTVTITIVDGGGAAVQDCSVQIWNTALDSLVSYGTTDANGQKQLSADDGIYKVKLKKAGYSFTDPENLTVSGNTNITYTGTSTIPSAPASVQSCRVYEYLFMADGSTPVPSIVAKAKIISLPEDSNLILHTGQEIDGIYNSDTGLVYWDIVKGAEVEFIIMNFGIKLIKIVPITDTARLVDIA